MSEGIKNEVKQVVRDRNFALSTWAVGNKVTVYVIIAIIFIAGVFAFFNMSKESFPEIIQNKIYISSIFPGNSPEDIEKFITKRIEDGIRGISKIIDVKSTSFNDYAMTVVEFDDKIPINEAKAEIKDKIDQVKSDHDWPVLDTGAKVEPYVFHINISEEIPIAFINITGNYDLNQLEKFAKMLRDEIENLPEVKEAPVRGVDEKEVVIALDVYKMSATKVSFYDVTSSISMDNKTISAGNFVNEQQKISLRVAGEINNLDELLNISVKQRNQSSVYLRDIAEVKFQEKDKSTYARLFGDPVVMLSVSKRSGMNIIETSRKVSEIVKTMQKTIFPMDLTVKITGNLATKVENQVNDLINNIILGIILVVVVLMFFLGLRNAFFVGISIPLSMLMSLIILHAMGSTMNTMVLFGLVMGLGMLVDNGIVIVENVYTLINKGYSRTEAAIQGVGEIAWPIIASTATTLAAFFPLALWPGTIGKFMIYFPMTLSVVLSSSLFVALVINAMMTSQFMQKEIKKSGEGRKRMIQNTLIGLIFGVFFFLIGYVKEIIFFRIVGNLLIFSILMVWIYKYILYQQIVSFQERGFPLLEELYQNFLEWILSKKRSLFTLLGMFGLLFFCFVLMSIIRPKVLFFPENEPNDIFIYAEYPEGTDIEKTNHLVKRIEEKVSDVLKKYVVKENGEDYNYMVESILSRVGTGATNPNSDAGFVSDIPHKGKISISFRDFKHRRGVQSSDVMEEVRATVKGFVGASITVEKDQVGPPTGYPINIQISGSDYEEIMKEAQKMIAYLSSLKIEGIEELKIDVTKDLSQMEIKINRKMSGFMGVKSQMIGGLLRQSVFGLEVSRYRPKGDQDDYPINVRIMDAQRYDRDVVFNQPITFTNASNGRIMQIPIASLIEMEERKQFSKIKRQDYKKTITLYSNVIKGYNANEITNILKRRLIQDDYKIPIGMTYSFTGEQKQQSKNMSFLLKALMIGLGAIILIVVMQFNSISKPIIIMISIILSFIGVFLGLIVTGSDFVILMTMMGIISLAGIVVNNAIVLIDYTQLLLDRRKEELNISISDFLPYDEMRILIIAGGKSRFRPVFLTAITTVLGLLPLSVGFNIDFIGILSDYRPNIYIGGDNVIFWGPLAKTVIYGLIFSSFLTLVMVPILQILINELKFRMKYGKNAKKYPYQELINFRV